LILADEPTGNLDSQTGKHIVDLLFGLQRRRNATLMLVTHDQRVAAACARTIHMADGRIDTVAEARVAS
jgi:putative ABC transport system ATP-binding protein